MASPVNVSDSLANHEEMIERYAKELISSKRREAVFRAVYAGRKPAKTISEIMAASGLKRQAVLDAGHQLEGSHLVEKTERPNGSGKPEQAYGKVSFGKRYRDKILRFVDNPDLLKRLNTKRNSSVSVSEKTTTIKINQSLFTASKCTIDDIDSFDQVRAVESEKTKLEGFSEDVFKKAIQKIIGQGGEFKDWGGEKSDLFTTKVHLNGRRLTAAFAFKGPGLRAKLTIAKMGKNGDQMPRLFSESADIYFVQHWREIDPSVHELMEVFAIMKSATMAKPIYYCIIDGNDSERLYRAYPEAFTP